MFIGEDPKLNTDPEGLSRVDIPSFARWNSIGSLADVDSQPVDITGSLIWTIGPVAKDMAWKPLRRTASVNS